MQGKGHRQRGVPSRQRGVAIVLFTIGALAVLAMAGLALDLGRAYLLKTRLQNALDAAALSGAYSLSQGLGTTQASADALATFTQNAGGLPEGTPTPVVEFSPTVSPFSPGGANPQYVRVSVTGMPSPVVLAVVVPGVAGTLSLNGRAVAGGIALGRVCNAIPVAICGQNTDTDCSDGTCYGLSSGELTITVPGGANPAIGPGNYGYVQFDDSKLRDGLAGGGDFCFDAGGTVKTKTGVNSGSASQGFNTRFGIYKGPVSPSDYPADLVSSTSVTTYAGYEAAYGSENYDHPTGKAQRRVPVAPVINCSPAINGSGNASVIGSVCLFLTRPMDGSNGNIYGEIAPNCLAEGDIAPDPGSGGSGAQAVVLYPSAGG